MREGSLFVINPFLIVELNELLENRSCTRMVVHQRIDRVRLATDLERRSATPRTSDELRLTAESE